MRKVSNKYVKANQSKRFVAYIIDWFLGALIIMFPISIYYLAQTNDISTLSGVTINTIANEYGDNQAVMIGIISIVLGICYYVLIPILTNGQTLGKKMFDLKIVNNDEKLCTTKQLIMRQFVILIVFETYLYSVSHMIIYIMELTLNTEVIKYYYTFGLVVTASSCLLVAFTHNHFAIHDLFAKTKVIGIVSETKDQKI